MKKFLIPAVIAVALVFVSCEKNKSDSNTSHGQTEMLTESVTESVKDSDARGCVEVSESDSEIREGIDDVIDYTDEWCESILGEKILCQDKNIQDRGGKKYYSAWSNV